MILSINTENAYVDGSANGTGIISFPKGNIHSFRWEYNDKEVRIEFDALRNLHTEKVRSFLHDQLPSGIYPQEGVIGFAAMTHLFEIERIA